MLLTLGLSAVLGWLFYSALGPGVFLGMILAVLIMISIQLNRQEQKNKQDAEEEDSSGF
ncbi:hypothetical protein LCM20_09835 [Halobacillus litoralis]|uniref:hypothetical protein n=1 Tax=Halobacillus litoralis TaxID=45668 RepID=UPI001CD22300|nr:hypothetical protein [Halobacillus litoralis]MCA0970890.1 hypothetical protein [Halobacillus litoralis]